MTHEPAPCVRSVMIVGAHIDAKLYMSWISYEIDKPKAKPFFLVELRIHDHIVFYLVNDNGDIWEVNYRPHHPSLPEKYRSMIPVHAVPAYCGDPQIIKDGIRRHIEANKHE